jgi:hypothetical protein
MEDVKENLHVFLTIAHMLLSNGQLQALIELP